MSSLLPGSEYQYSKNLCITKHLFCSPQLTSYRQAGPTLLFLPEQEGVMSSWNDLDPPFSPRLPSLASQISSPDIYVIEPAGMRVSGRLSVVVPFTSVVRVVQVFFTRVTCRTGSGGWIPWPWVVERCLGTEDRATHVGHWWSGALGEGLDVGGSLMSRSIRFLGHELMRRLFSCLDDGSPV
jgi:hypothetical protein